MDYLIRLAQMHEDFRLAEIKSLALLHSIKIQILSYSTHSPFLIIRILSYLGSTFSTAAEAARAIISRSVLSGGIYELWGMSDESSGSGNYENLHSDVRARTSTEIWSQYKDCSFKFSVDAFSGKRTPAEQREIINGFSYLGFEGQIVMQSPGVEFCVFEEWSMDRTFHDQKKAPGSESGPLGFQTNHGIEGSTPTSDHSPHRLYLGRLIATSPRAHLAKKHSLKTRPYISTTSMDAVLALVTANLALVAPTKLIYDPFVGTGGFLLAAAEFGAEVWGSDIDGRSFRGTGGKSAKTGRGCDAGVGKNFKKYGLGDLFADCFIGDLTHSPFRRPSPQCPHKGLFDAIISDPPYGVREGLKVLGSREEQTENRGPHMIDGVPAHQCPGYIAPKKPYSFARMLDDILDFAADMLVENGRLTFWMPSANEDNGDLRIPGHHDLELIECSVQSFNKWSRRLLVYRRRTIDEVNMGPDSGANTTRRPSENIAGKTASDLNPFRRKYFEKSRT